MKRRNCVRLIVGIVLILAGVVWYFYPSYREWKIDAHVKKVKSSIEGDAHIDNAPEEKEDETLKSTLYDEMCVYNDRLVKDGQIITDAWNCEQPPVSIPSIDSADPVIGYIEIPDMEVTLPLYVGASDTNLTKGAAVLSGTSMPIGGINTNSVICAHRGWHGSAFFRNIENMKTGSYVYVVNPWQTLVYKAVSAKIITSGQIGEVFIQPGKDMVTLFSCYPYTHARTPYRYVVYCERVEDGFYNEKTDAQNNGNDGEKQQMVVEGENINPSVKRSEQRLLFWESLLRTYLPIAVLVIALLAFVITREKKKR